MKITEWEKLTIEELAIEKFIKKIIKATYKMKGKTIQKDIGEYDKLISCWDLKDELKRIKKEMLEE